MPTSSKDLAQELMDCVPLIMRAIRAEMRSHREAGLSVPQFRSMLFIHHHHSASLSQLADHLGLTPPSASSLIDKLVKRGLVLRSSAVENRRQIQLNLTEIGEAMLDSAQQLTIGYLSKLLDRLSTDEKIQAMEALQKLQTIFGS